MAETPYLREWSLALAAGGIAWLLNFPTANAELPQVLALAETQEPMPLHCADGTCSAEFTTFCLQEHNRAPQTGTPYRPSEATELRLSYLGEDGQPHEIDAAPYATVTAERSFAAVRISFDATALAALQAADIGLVVGPRAALVPKAADRANLAAILKLREIAARLLGSDPDTQIAQAIQRRINADSSDADELQRLRALHDETVARLNVRIWDALAGT